jgi:hypothetical protein
MPSLWKALSVAFKGKVSSRTVPLRQAVNMLCVVLYCAVLHFCGRPCTVPCDKAAVQRHQRWQSLHGLGCADLPGGLG